MLTVENVVPYLITRGVVSPADVTDGRLRIEDLTRRNRSFKIVIAGEGGFLAKQPRNHREDMLVESVEREAAILNLLAHDDTLDEFRPYAPEVVDHDRASTILVTRLVHPATSMTKLYLNGGRIQFPIEAGESAARLLAKFHTAGERALSAGRLNGLLRARETPLALNIASYIDNRRRVGDDLAAQVLRELEASALAPGGELAKKAAAAFTAHDGVVHGDARWENFLLTHGTSPGGYLNLRLIDWELILRGDPAYDLVSYIGEHYRFWLMLIKPDGVSRTEDLPARQAFDLATTHEGTQALLQRYAATRVLSPEATAALVDRIRLYMPFYLTLIAWELCLASAMITTTESIPVRARSALEAANACAKEPAAATQRLFGLEVPR